MLRSVRTIGIKWQFKTTAVTKVATFINTILYVSQSHLRGSKSVGMVHEYKYCRQTRSTYLTAIYHTSDPE